MRFLLVTIGFIVLAGCSSFDFPPRLEFSSTWVSKEGKSQEQLHEDQKECTREAMMVSSPAFQGDAGMGRGGGGDMKAFNRCMRAKGWEKQQ